MQVKKVACCHRGASQVNFGIALPNGLDAVEMREGQWVKDDAVYRDESRDIDANSEGQSDNGNRRGEGCLQQRASGVLKILRETVHDLIRIC